jgi:hypothetical protein
LFRHARWRKGGPRLLYKTRHVRKDHPRSGS